MKWAEALAGFVKADKLFDVSSYWYGGFDPIRKSLLFSPALSFIALVRLRAGKFVSPLYSYRLVHELVNEPFWDSLRL